MRLRLIAAAALLLGLAAASAQQSAPTLQSGPAGRWLTEGREGVIEIAPCGAGFCGRIVGMDSTRRPDGSLPRDKSGRAQCDLEILRVVQTGPGRWGGQITNPEDGSVWNCTLSLDGQGRLDLRGYVLVPLLGRTQVWTRYSGALGSDCRMGVVAG